MAENGKAIEAALQGLVERAVGFGWRTESQRRAAVDLLVGLNALAAALRPGAAGDKVAGAMRGLAHCITKLAAGRRGGRQFVVEMMAGLRELAVESGISQVGAELRKAAVPGGGHRRGDFAVTYVVRKARSGEERLFEQREGSRKSLSASKADYGAAIKAMADFDRPAKFSELWDRFVANGGTEASSQYPLRVVLRFWQSLSPPLIAKQRARFSMDDADGWDRLAQQAWIAARGR